MSSLPPPVPLTLALRYSHPLGEQAPYFQGLADGRGVASRCPVCARTWFPPRLRCPDHAGPVEWVELSGVGTVVSVTRTTVALPFGGGREERLFTLVALDGAENLAFGRIAAGQDATAGCRVRLVRAPGVWPHPAQAACYELL